VPPTQACARAGPSSPEVTRGICRVPSTPFSQAPGYTLPVHLCRFGVRSWCCGCFLEDPGRPDNPISPNGFRPSSPAAGWGIFTPFPSATAFALALGARLTLRGLTLRRNPWTFGDRVSHSVDRYSCQHSHFRCLQHTSRCTFTGLRNAPLPRALARTSAASVHGLSPVTFSARDGLSRPVSYYAFFKGWLLLSQPPGCLGLPTSFPTEP
jgi:hypothetical protein